jgi:hypothetical protein
MPRHGLPKLPDATLGGVRLDKTMLEAETERLQSITRAWGLRLKRELKRRGPESLPDEGMVEVFRYYQATVLGQLREQRERYRQSGGENTPTATLEAQFRVEVLLAIKTFSAADWEIADRVRVERTGPGRWVQEPA